MLLLYGQDFDWDFRAAHGTRQLVPMRNRYLLSLMLFGLIRCSDKASPNALDDSSSGSDSDMASGSADASGSMAVGGSTSDSAVTTPTASGDTLTADGGAGNAGAAAGGGPSDIVDEVASEPTVTWHGDIAPLVARHCSGCHQAGGIAPFSLETYGSARPFAELALDRIQDGSMPPWGAINTEECEAPHAWRDDPTLSDADVALFAQWVSEGAPEGDASAAAALPDPPSLSLEDPTLSLGMGTEVVVEGNQDQFLCFSLDPGLDEDVWVTASQVNPGNTQVVHHVLLFADSTGESAELAGPDGSYPCFGGPRLSTPQLLAAWAPGSVPSVVPDGVAMQLKAGSRLVMNVHYHPTGEPQTDSETSVDLKFSTREPEYTGLFLLVGNFASEAEGLMPGPNDPGGTPQFMIPAGESAHVETQRVAVSTGLSVLGSRIFAVGTHMHLIGKDMKLALEHRDGSESCLLQTPQWDFDWQRAYYYDVPVSESPQPAAGDALTLRCTYDNTLDNPGTRTALDEQGLSEPVDVYLGEESLDEMCIGIFGLAIPGAWDSDLIFSQL